MPIPLITLLCAMEAGFSLPLSHLGFINLWSSQETARRQERILQMQTIPRLEIDRSILEFTTFQGFVSRVHLSSHLDIHLECHQHLQKVSCTSWNPTLAEAEVNDPSLDSLSSLKDVLKKLLWSFLQQNFRGKKPVCFSVPGGYNFTSSNMNLSGQKETLLVTCLTDKVRSLGGIS